MDDTIMERLVQIGTVTGINSIQRKARVKFKNTGIVSGWLTVIQHYGANLHIEPDAKHTHVITDTYTGGGDASTEPNHNHLPGSHLTCWMPKINDTVLVLYLPVRDGDGYILGGI